MAEAKIHLWVDLPGGLIPTTTVQHDDNWHAAALGLSDFSQLGYDISKPGGYVDVERNPVEPKPRLMIADVLHWLAQPEQTSFVKAEHLELLVQ